MGRGLWGLGFAEVRGGVLRGWLGRFSVGSKIRRVRREDRRVAGRFKESRRVGWMSE